MNNLQEYVPFLDKFFLMLSEKGINLNQFVIDHIGYQAKSSQEYNQRVNELCAFGSIVSENIVGDRRVGIIKLNKPLIYRSQNFNVIEIIEPKLNQIVESGWEHVELLFNKSLEELIQEYPTIVWDTSVIDRAEFPQLILKLSDTIRAKFPRLGVLAELNRLKSN
jgi:predicted metalloenzyme YecM